MSEEFVDTVDVRCRGCYIRMGVGNGPPMHKVFCSRLCSRDIPISENEDRDAVIEMLVRLRSWTPTRIAMNFDISRQRARQVIDERIPREARLKK